MSSPNTGNGGFIQLSLGSDAIIGCILTVILPVWSRSKIQTTWMGSEETERFSFSDIYNPGVIAFEMYFDTEDNVIWPTGGSRDGTSDYITVTLIDKESLDFARLLGSGAVTTYEFHA